MDKLIRKMMMIKRVFFLLLFIHIPIITMAQKDDMGVWIGVNAEHKLIRNLDAELSASIRSFNHSSQIELMFLEGALKYKLNKYISFAGSYRLISNIENDSRYYYRHKLYLDLKTSVPLKNLTISGRLRLQRATKTYIEDDEDLISKYYGRLKIMVDYDIPSFPLTPNIYIEPFTPLFSNSDFKISKMRFSAGIELKINNKNSLETAYIFQREYKSVISDEHIISVNYKFKY
jgi:hypothetical protein